MSYVLKTNLSNRANYGSTRSASSIKWLVFHYTANDGDTDEANGKYFAGNVVKASAHYFVDDNSVTQSVPDLYAAYAVGGKKWNDCWKTGGGKLYGKVTNKNSISIELCDPKRDGKIQPSEATLTNAVELGKKLMKKYNIDLDHVIRHFDVNGKHCPAYFMDEKEWNKFKARLGTVKPTTVTVDIAKYHNKAYSKKWTTTASLNMRTGAGTDKKIIRTLQKGEKVTCYGYYNKNGSTIWLYVLDKNGTLGYCSKNYLS